MHNSLEEFVDYIYSFYNVVDGLYPVYGCTKHKITSSVYAYWDKIQENPSMWGDGDSLDRERVRDIMFEMFPSISYAKTNS